MAHVLLGEMNAARADFAAAAALTEELRLPVEEHNVEGARAMLALAAGKLDAARASIDTAYAIGLRVQPDMAEPNYVVQQYTLFDLQGRAGEAAEAVEKLARDYPARPVFTCVLAHLYARIGRSRQAAEMLEQLCANECGPIPFDQEWLYALTLLSEAAWVVEHQDAAATIYPLLLPWSELTAADHVEGYGGAASRYLGLLASTLERSDEAEAHFTDALARNVRMGALPWAAHTQRDHAHALRQRRPNDPRAAELLARASRTYRSLGMPNPSTSLLKHDGDIRARWCRRLLLASQAHDNGRYQVRDPTNCSEPVVPPMLPVPMIELSWRLLPLTLTPQLTSHTTQDSHRHGAAALQ